MTTNDHPEPRKDQPVRAWALFAVPFTMFAYFAGQFLGFMPVLVYLFMTNQADEQSMLSLESSVIYQFFVVLSIELATVGLLYLAMRLLRITAGLIGWLRPKLRDLAYALAGYGSYFVTYYLLIIVISIAVSSINLDQEQELGFDPSSIQGPELLLVFISLVILPAVVEELLMRGFLYTGLRTRLNQIASVLITSALFALAHLQWGNNAPLLWIAAIDTFILSIVLCYLREKTGSLAAPIMLHGLKNSIAFAVLFIFKVA